jgi:hypothetical protein
MKMNMKMIAVAVAMAASGAANAAFTYGAAGGADTSLVFAAWNGTTSYIENLSATNAAGLAGAWIAGNGTPASASFTLNPLFASTFTSGTGLNWAVFGGTGAIGAQVVNTTGLSNVTASAANNIGGANNSLDAWFAALNSTPVGTNNFGTIALTDANSPAIVAPGYNGFIQGTTSMTGYGYMDFVSLADLGTPVLFSDTPAKGFTLAANGALTYGEQAAVSSVPLPAAAWLFGSGLLGLIGIGRRKQS